MPSLAPKLRHTGPAEGTGGPRTRAATRSGTGPAGREMRVNACLSGGLFQELEAGPAVGRDDFADHGGDRVAALAQAGREPWRPLGRPGGEKAPGTSPGGA